MKLPKLKKLLEDKNKTKIIGLLTILIALWLVLYFIPEIFVSLLNTLLGNIILFIIVLLIFLKNKIYGLLVGLLIIILIRTTRLSQESFTTDSTNTFLKMEYTINKQNIFDMDIINQQASQEELNYFNQNGMWPWSQEVIDLYNEMHDKNIFVRSTSGDSTNYVRTIYNQNAILRILSYQTKEGNMLLNGVLVKNPNSPEQLPNGYGDFGYNSGLKGDMTNDIIKCNLMKDGENPQLERITYTGKGGIFGQQTKKIEDVDYNNLENIIPGFKFINEPCNPCKSVGAIADYSCPFSIKTTDETYKGIKKDENISSIWNYLWGN
jgi:hypothetical protein